MLFPLENYIFFSSLWTKGKDGLEVTTSSIGIHNGRNLKMSCRNGECTPRNSLSCRLDFVFIVSLKEGSLYQHRHSPIKE
ncbi:hypothetical protein POVCU2_0012510 [Plasmodium ovale curtisi]|uniref:Uncharacterized protein n=1 Tax=Plasmodium ovale curtisi TaxID=864141 RepID=A0A1A8VRC9_PLAOA|nr:hypothetical protein POVCU2_0012510 [Plasmodium ovale curtisi]SBS84842.1 hypothetical protein POVCU1_011540 [Plasmodium ovale curtisi]